MRKTKVSTWSMPWVFHGAYARLYVPIGIIILVVTAVRYHALLGSERDEAQERMRAELRTAAHAVLQQLPRGPLDPDAVDALLRRAVSGRDPAIHTVRWDVEDQETRALRLPPPAMQAPHWFANLIDLQPPLQTLPHRLADGRTGQLTLTLWPQPQIDRAWHALVVQSRITALNVFTILFLLTLLLQANRRMLVRLREATERFRQGHLDTRMPLAGTQDAREVATTFNDMAGKVQSLVMSLQETQRLQSEQLHFRRQLIDALPLPIFVRGADGARLETNQAWRDLLGSPRPLSAAGTFEQIWADTIDTAATLPQRLAAVPSGHELTVRPPHREAREMAYYHATFTAPNGRPAGTIGALVDVTERKQAQQALGSEKERAEITLASIADGVITTDLQGQVQTINEAAQWLTGFSPEQALGRPLSEVFHLEEDAPMQAQLSGFGEELPGTLTQQVLLHRSGERYAVEYSVAAIREHDGRASGCVLVFRDVTEARHLRQQLSWRARHDALTGLHNRDALSERLTHGIFRAQQHQHLLAVCMLDLDHFQAINEQHGRWVADRLLKEVGLRLRAFCGPEDAVARMGGDEFALLLSDMPDVPAIEARMHALQQQLAQPYAIDDTTIQATASAGVTIFPLDHGSPDLLLRHADQAMCQAKSAGRAAFHLFDVGQDLQVQTQHHRQTRVAQALHQGELRLFYQAKVNLRDGEILGMEALLRWQHPDKGLLGPQEVLEQLEDTALIIELGEWVLQTALADLRHWTRVGHAWDMSVNIAAPHFHYPRFVERLQEFLQACPEVPAQRLELEILESSALEDVPTVRQVMQRCQALGVRFALDDFGTGYSSLSYLKRLPAQTIKIDQSFVHNMTVDAEDLALVTAIVGLAGAFQRQVIAEGVETAEQCLQLLALGCERAQGFGIAQPMAAQAVLPWFHSQATHGRLPLEHLHIQPSTEG